MDLKTPQLFIKLFLTITTGRHLKAIFSLLPFSPQWIGIFLYCTGRHSKYSPRGAQGGSLRLLGKLYHMSVCNVRVYSVSAFQPSSYRAGILVYL